MIEIKSLFSDWHEVTKEQAKKYVLWFIKHSPGVKDKEKIEYIHKNKLRGVTIQELFTADELIGLDEFMDCEKYKGNEIDKQVKALKDLSNLTEDAIHGL